MDSKSGNDDKAHWWDKMHPCLINTRHITNDAKDAYLALSDNRITL